MLICRDNNDKIFGRALVWFDCTLDGVGGPITFMDRIYYVSEDVLHLFKDFAKQREWFFKQAQSYENGSITNGLSGELEVKYDGNILFNLLVNGYSYYPYLDTLYCYSSSEKTLECSPRHGRYVELRCTEGGNSEEDNEDMRYSEHYGESIHEDDACYVESRDDVQECVHSGDWIHIDDAIYCEDIDGYIWHEDAHYSERDDCSYSEAVYSNFLEDNLQENMAIGCVVLDTSGNTISGHSSDHGYEEDLIKVHLDVLKEVFETESEVDLEELEEMVKIYGRMEQSNTIMLFRDSIEYSTIFTYYKEKWDRTFDEEMTDEAILECEGFTELFLETLSSATN